MMLPFIRQFLLVLIAVALVGGPTTQLAHSTQYVAPMVMAGMPCDMAMPMAGAEHGSPMTPCKGMTPACIKQMGCVTDAALPARLVSVERAAHLSDVDYWSAWSKLASLSRIPEPLPPRTI